MKRNFVIITENYNCVSAGEKVELVGNLHGAIVEVICNKHKKQMMIPKRITRVQPQYFKE